MSNHRQDTAPGPSLVSITVMAAATLSTIGVGLWIIWGATDERHLAGGGIATVLAVVLTAQTMGRTYERATAQERQQARQRRFLAEAARRVEERASGGARTMILGELAPIVPGQPWPQPIEQVGPWEDRHPTQRLPRPKRGHEVRRLQMPLPPREEMDPESDSYPQYPS